MAISNQQQQYQKTGFDLSQLVGTGDSNWSDDVTAVLLEIQPREGMYNVVDRDGNPVIDPSTGRQMQRPNTWVAYFSDGSMFNWTVFQNEQGQIVPWSRFDPSINLVQCRAQNIAVHVWRDKNRRMHLEIAQQQEQQVMSMTQANRAPWE